MIQVHIQLRTSCNGNAKGFFELSIVVVAFIFLPHFTPSNTEGA